MRKEQLEVEKRVFDVWSRVNHLELLSKHYNLILEMRLFTDREGKPRWVMKVKGGRFESADIVECAQMVAAHINKINSIKLP